MDNPSPQPSEQRCGSCKETLPLDSFSPSYRGKTGTWCRKCFADYNAGRKQTRGTHEPRVCDWCGESYVPTQLKAHALFCSRECKDLSRKSAARKARAEAKAARVCEACGDSVATMRSNARVCSVKCAMHLRQKEGRITPAMRRGYVLKKYGMTASQFDAMLASQDNRCAICRTDDPGNKPWAIDHCHDKGHVRGILCSFCNLALGLFKDNPANLRAATAYLEKHRY